MKAKPESLGPTGTAGANSLFGNREVHQLLHHRSITTSTCKIFTYSHHCSHIEPHQQQHEIQLFDDATLRKLTFDPGPALPFGAICATGASRAKPAYVLIVSAHPAITSLDCKALVCSCTVCSPALFCLWPSIPLVYHTPRRTLT